MDRLTDDLRCRPQSVLAIGREIRNLSSCAQTATLTPAERNSGTASFVELGALVINEVTVMPQSAQTVSLSIGKAVQRMLVNCVTERVGTMISATAVSDRRAIRMHDAAGSMTTFQELIDEPLLRPA